MNLGESFGFDVIQSVSLVPTYDKRGRDVRPLMLCSGSDQRTLGEHIKGDLTTDRVGQAEMGKFLLKDLDHFGSDAGLL